MSVPATKKDHPVFQLPFPVDDVPFWAEQYHYADRGIDPEVIGAKVRKAGWLTFEQFEALATWKTRRVRSRRARNSKAFVKCVTQAALSATEPRFKIEVLTLLDGVDYPTASTILHFCDKARWPIIDFRALWTLGQAVPEGGYRFEFWNAYTHSTRELATTSQITMRTLDRALWAYSKKYQRSRTS